MEINGEAKLLRIFLGDSDTLGSVSVHEKIVYAAREKGIAGATVYKGIMGFGRSSRIHSAKFLTISEDLPLVVEIVDELKKIEEFLPTVQQIFEDAGCGGLITCERADIIQYVEKKE